ncbi:4190_t:CDS:2 [Acaulospora morrowiae]|uniref:4190_t:CDS:1 n=1 Tax=Acaulospora morrowiae TaxID=94023 RepID=A0A9N8VGC2_9GLOM|nr:4190_t:CDS:2 [Acaulospora morrowiae]
MSSITAFLERPAINLGSYSLPSYCDIAYLSVKGGKKTRNSYRGTSITECNNLKYTPKLQKYVSKSVLRNL